MVMETKKIFTKINLIQQAQNKCIMVRRNIDFFTNKFENLVKMGLPTVWNDKGKILTFECYKRDMFKVRENEDKFQGITEVLKGQTIVDILIDDFYLLW
jgi:hypothetical protein